MTALIAGVSLSVVGFVFILLALMRRLKEMERILQMTLTLGRIHDKGIDAIQESQRRSYALIMRELESIKQNVEQQTKQDDGTTN